MSQTDIGQLLSSVVSLEDPPRRRVGLLTGAIALYFVGWIAFLCALTITRLHQSPYLFYDERNRTSWFDPLNGVYICFGFLLPASAIAINALLDWLMTRYSRQAHALVTLLRQKDVNLTPTITPHWSVPFLGMPPAKIRGIHPLGWHTGGRHYRIWHMLLSGAILLAQSVTSLVSLTHLSVVGEQPIDTVTPLVALGIILLLFIASVRALSSNWTTVRINEMGLALPPGNLSRPTPPILWHEIRALYHVEGIAKYWLLFTDEHVYGWLVSSGDFRQRGAQLEHIIVERTGLPICDATAICKLASSSNIPKTPTTPAFALFERWQQTLNLAQQYDTRRPSFMPAIILTVAGGVMGFAATAIIAQLATAWASH